MPDPVEGQLIVRNIAISVDPYMRGRMNDVPSYVPPFELGEPLDGGAVGEVIASAVDALPPGDVVPTASAGASTRSCPRSRRSRRSRRRAAVRASSGVLGMTGLTAYAGLFDVAGMQRGRRGVRLRGRRRGRQPGRPDRQGCAGRRVIGSAGRPSKVGYLRDELGFDAAFDYRDGAVAEPLRAAAPDGIDVYFDNVGGDHLEAAIGVAQAARPRRAVRRDLDLQRDRAAPGPRNLALAIGKRLTLRGFIVSDHYGPAREFAREVGGWLRVGELVRRDRLEGLDTRRARLHRPASRRQHRQDVVTL